MNLSYNKRACHKQFVKVKFVGNISYKDERDFMNINNIEKYADGKSQVVILDWNYSKEEAVYLMITER